MKIGDNMKIMKQIFFILLFYILGELLSRLIRFALPSIFIPGTILGMILLVVALCRKWVKLEHVEDVGNFLTSNMAFFFIPAAVGVMEYFDLLKTDLFKILILVVVSLIISFFAIMGSVKLTVYLQKKWGKKYE